MRQTNPFGTLIFIIIFGVGGFFAYVVNGIAGTVVASCIGAGAFILAIIASSAIRVANQWDRAVILCLGQFHA